MKEPVNFYFRLKWFLCNGYSGRSEYPLRNQAEVVLSWFLFSSQKQLFMQVELYCCFDKIDECMMWMKAIIHASKITVFCFLPSTCLLIWLKV